MRSVDRRFQWHRSRGGLEGLHINALNQPNNIQTTMQTAILRSAGACHACGLQCVAMHRARHADYVRIECVEAKGRRGVACLIVPRCLAIADNEGSHDPCRFRMRRPSWPEIALFHNRSPKRSCDVAPLAKRGNCHPRPLPSTSAFDPRHRVYSGPGASATPRPARKLMAGVWMLLSGH